jgi:predicted kinase
MTVGRLLVVVGLPGAGKSWLIDNRLRQTITGLCIHDFHGDAINNSSAVKNSRHYVPLVKSLRAGRDCIIADIEFCRPTRRDAAVDTLRREFPSLIIEYHCVRNQPDRCIRNIIARGRQSESEERRKVGDLSREYVLPMGAIEYDVVEDVDA